MLQGKIPSEVVSKRRQYLNSMKSFIEEQEKKLADTLTQLGLSEEDISKVEVKKICPFNKDHIVPEKVYAKHVDKCRLLQAGYQKDELELQLETSDFWYEGHDSIMKVQLDEGLLNKIIWDNCVQTGQVYTGHRPLPVSHIDEAIHLTQDDRMAVYRHVVTKSHEAGKVIPWDRDDELLTTNWGQLVKKGCLSAENNKEFASKLEQLAALRDLKRRRQSYRAKNVHITKKSYTEIIREVIVNQMEVLRPAEDVKPAPEELVEVDDGRDEQDYGRRPKYEDRDRRKDRSRERDRSQRDGKRESDRDQRDRNRESDRHRERYRDRSRENRDRNSDRDKTYNYRGRDRERERDRGSVSFQGSTEISKKIKLSDIDKRQEDTPRNEPLLSDLNPDVEVKQEVLSEGEISSKTEEMDDQKKQRKRHSSLSSNTSQDEKADLSQKSSKHKKSKHKKKHSKKKKRRSRS